MTNEVGSNKLQAKSKVHTDLLDTLLYEPRDEKTGFCICRNKDADQLRSNCAADQRLFFATRIVESLFFLHPKFQTSSNLLWLCSLVCVGPGRKPRRPVFSQRGSYADDMVENATTETQNTMGY